MLIPVTCPECHSVYQLEESMRGKRMRCPNIICQAVFEVPLLEKASPSAGAAPVPPPEPGKPDRAPPAPSGNVADFVPVLPATIEDAPRIVPPPPLPAPPAPAPPPVRRTPVVEPPVSPATPTLDPLQEFDIPGDEPEAPAHSPASADGPRELAPGAWQAPPVRSDEPQRSEARAGFNNPRVTEASPASAKPASTKPLSTKPLAAEPGRGRRLAIVLMLLVLGGAGAGGYFMVVSRQQGNEEDRTKRARELYESQAFTDAALAYQKLLGDFPGSRNRSQYNFMRELASVRDSAEHAEDPSQGLDSVLQFIEIYQQDPQLKDRHGDVWQSLHKLTGDLTSLAEEKQEPAYLDLARKAWKHAKKFDAPGGTNVAEVERTISADFTRVQLALAVRMQRLQALEVLRSLLREPTAAAVQEARALVAKAGMSNDAEAKTILKNLASAHRAAVVFVPAGAYGKQPVVEEDEIPSLYVAPALGTAGPKADRPGVVPVLAHGVLYALEPASGAVRWVRRVGIDTTVPPLRVPATSILPERFLVLSSDSKSLTAVEAETGKVLWQRLLSEACLGQPVLVDHHVLVPTRSGLVEEIEVTGGKLQGHYKLGQSLSVGGVRQPGTSLVYFPADSFCIYVLDIARRTCVGTLYAGHASGSLRHLPAIWNELRSTSSAKEDAPGWLLLGRARHDGDEFVPYALPITDPDQKPAEPVLRGKGSSGFAPWHDAEKLAWASDAGYLATYGIRQKGNRDPLLFPLYKDDYVIVGTGDAGKSFIAHADPENYWVISRGRLHRLQAIFTSENGPELSPRWQEPPFVGAPLHAGHVSVDAKGKKLLVVTTQLFDRPTCLVSAIDALDGKIVWQRQLGLVCQGPLAAAGTLIACPDANGVVLFDASKLRTDKPPPWQPAGERAADAMPGAAQILLPSEKGIVRLAWTPAAQPDLEILSCNETGEANPKLHFKLQARPLGVLALGAGFVLIPLADGRVVRAPLGKGNLLDGPDWRGSGVDEKSPGYIVALENDDFVLTDGSRGLARIHWGDEKAWEKKAAADLNHRIVSPPAPLDDQRLAVADASDTLTLLNATRLEPIRRWSLPGKITAGPFVRDGRIGCVVGKDRLLWFDPAKDQPAWDQSFVAEIVGEPTLVEGVLVIADLAGRIQGIDVKTGQLIGPGYTLKANAPAAAAPVAFGPGRLFIPLMDGTVMLLPLDRLR